MVIRIRITTDTSRVTTSIITNGITTITATIRTRMETIVIRMALDRAIQIDGTATVYRTGTDGQRWEPCQWIDFRKRVLHSTQEIRTMMHAPRWTQACE